ncbi:EspA/EspE family type VII secretion system effector [Mycobacterium sp. 050134]|uniref:EspA/EspE family type VII secretion system effector n=1 Tax=Mycobacterium sp. 050134 TaxID=3096111 RepID=UPI002ED98810
MAHTIEERGGTNSGMPGTSWFNGIHNLVYAVQRGQGATAAAYQEDWLSFGANLGAVGGKATWYLRDKLPKLADGLKAPGPTPTPTTIIDTAMILISLMDLLNGFWVPDDGLDFDTGHKDFENTYLNLELGQSDVSKWDGDAARRYATLNKELQDLAAKMQMLDTKMQTCLQEHGEAVQKAHEVIALAVMSLFIAEGIALLMWAWPVIGPNWSVAFQIATVTTLLLTVCQSEHAVVRSSHDKSALIEAVTNDYSDVLDRATALAAFAAGEIPETPEKSIPPNPATSTTISMMSGPSARPTVMSLAHIAGKTSTGGRAAPGTSTCDLEPAGNAEISDHALMAIEVGDAELRSAALGSARLYGWPPTPGAQRGQAAVHTTKTEQVGSEHVYCAAEGEGAEPKVDTGDAQRALLDVPITRAATTCAALSTAQTAAPKL